jgi:Raf kinase inhibitor-like YbhB/YbcL family protein
MIMATTTKNSLIVNSVAFSAGGHIPAKYSCEGEDINPPLEITGFPEGTKTLAIIVEDPDAPRGTFDHWLVWNIPPNEPIDENSARGISGRNGFGKTGYGGPCPPSGSHRYFFRVYALDTQLSLSAGSDKKALQDAMKDHILASGELMARYQKKGQWINRASSLKLKNSPYKFHVGFEQTLRISWVKANSLELIKIANGPSVSFKLRCICRIYSLSYSSS